MATLNQTLDAIQRHVGFPRSRGYSVARRLQEVRLLPLGGPGIAPELDQRDVCLLLAVLMSAPALSEVIDHARAYSNMTPSGAVLSPDAPESIPRSVLEYLEVQSEVAVGGTPDAVADLRGHRYEFVHGWRELSVQMPEGTISGLSLSLDNSVFVKEKHYVAFVDKYSTPPELGCDGQTCYRLRGGVIHRANLAGHALIGVTNVIFTLPESTLKVHALSLQVGDKIAPTFDLILFCKTMMRAAHAWYEDNQNDPKVEANMKNLIRYCENGLAPFVVGQPLVASGI